MDRLRLLPGQTPIKMLYFRICAQNMPASWHEGTKAKHHHDRGSVGAAVVGDGFEIGSQRNSDIAWTLRGGLPA